MGHYTSAMADRPERAVFIDETRVKTNLTCLRGRTLRGTRLTIDASFGRWGTQTLIAGLTPDARIAPLAHQGRTGPSRRRDLCARGPDPGDRAGNNGILDNLATHRNKQAAEALRAHRCWFLYLPLYSSDLNPIKMALAKLKAHLGRIGARTFTDVFKVIGEMCDLFDPNERWNCLKAAGYVAG